MVALGHRLYTTEPRGEVIERVTTHGGVTRVLDMSQNSLAKTPKPVDRAGVAVRPRRRPLLRRARPVPDRRRSRAGVEADSARAAQRLRGRADGGPRDDLGRPRPPLRARVDDRPGLSRSGGGRHREGRPHRPRRHADDDPRRARLPVRDRVRARRGPCTSRTGASPARPARGRSSGSRSPTSRRPSSAGRPPVSLAARRRWTPMAAGITVGAPPWTSACSARSRCAKRAGRSRSAGASSGRCSRCSWSTAARPCPSDRLIEALWDARPPASAANSVHVYVSQLRRALGDGRLVTAPCGYALEVGDDELDSRRFERLAAEGRARLAVGDAAGAVAAFAEGLELWRGPALADFVYAPFAAGEIARLEEERVVALADRAEAELALGAAAELVPGLEELVREHPLPERARPADARALTARGARPTRSASTATGGASSSASSGSSRGPSCASSGRRPSGTTPASRPAGLRLVRRAGRASSSSLRRRSCSPRRSAPARSSSRAGAPGSHR